MYTTFEYLLYGKKSCHKFYFNKLHKSWKKGKKPPAVTYQEYSQDESLVLWVPWMNILSGKRGGDLEKSTLLLSFIHPHKPVVLSTVSGWLKTILMKSGVPLRLIEEYMHQALKQVHKDCSL